MTRTDRLFPGQDMEILYQAPEFSARADSTGEQIRSWVYQCMGNSGPDEYPFDPYSAQRELRGFVDGVTTNPFVAKLIFGYSPAANRFLILGLTHRDTVQFTNGGTHIEIDPFSVNVKSGAEYALGFLDAGEFRRFEDEETLSIYARARKEEDVRNVRYLGTISGRK